MEPDAGGGEELQQLRDVWPLPHQCRCIVYTKGVPAEVARLHESRCQELVLEGPDAPLCIGCQEKHWTPPPDKLPFGRRLAGLEGG